MKPIFLLLSPLLLVAKVHYAKVEPLESITLKSAVSAQVTQTKISKEGTTFTGKIISLDNHLDKIKLENSKKSLAFVKSMIEINNNILITLQESMNRQESHYYKLESINSASNSQKDNAFYAYSNAKTQYFSTQEKIVNLKRQKIDLNNEIMRLKESIRKKNITVQKKFIDKILVHKGDFVNMGTPLAKIKDLSSAKLVLFLEEDELKDIKSKTIYINDKATKYKIKKIWKVTDEKFISSYRSEIIIAHPKENFSSLLKVELKR